MRACFGSARPMGENDVSADISDRLKFEVVLFGFVETIRALREYTVIIGKFLDTYHAEQVTKHGGDLYPLAFAVVEASQTTAGADELGTAGDWLRVVREAAEAT